MVAIIGGDPRQFRPLIDLYREAGRRSGHPAEALTVGVHVPGLVGESDDEAAEAWYPGWAAMMNTIGKERGFRAFSREAFDVARGPHGAMFVGNADTVAAKIIAMSEALGGLARVTLQMTNQGLSHQDLLRGIELLGTRVAPTVRGAVTAQG
jgi:alkanesulfonate monooxygenase SsuD/methylene tetrahydromethanopterin reductase-like flavin-dependent oxidoreductase (luciferase family)